MIGKSFKTFLYHLLETVGALLLAIICFLVFLIVLKLLFPTGTPLSEMMKDAGHRQGPNAREGEKPEPFAASIARYYNIVRAKRSADIAWSDVSLGMLLYPSDAVQTGKQSGALIAFEAANSLEMSSNSLLIVKSLTKDQAHKLQKSVLLVIDGELRAKLSGSANYVVRMDMLLPAGGAWIQSQTSANGKADFMVRVNPDKSSTIIVHSGTAEVTADGKTVSVGADLSTTVGPTGPPTTPGALPAPPVPVSPVAEAGFVYRDLPPKIHFSWQGPEHAKYFRFKLARDPGFKKVVVDEKVGEAGFSHGNLGQGVYYWKVSSFDGWTEGKASPARRFRVTRNPAPPRLQVEFPPSMLEDSRYLLKGTTDAGAEVFINNKPVSTGPGGEFAHLLHLQRGINEITVEAVDAAGNITYKTHRVICKY